MDVESAISVPRQPRPLTFIARKLTMALLFEHMSYCILFISEYINCCFPLIYLRIPFRLECLKKTEIEFEY